MMKYNNEFESSYEREIRHYDHTYPVYSCMPGIHEMVTATESFARCTNNIHSDENGKYILLDIPDEMDIESDDCRNRFFRALRDMASVWKLSRFVNEIKDPDNILSHGGIEYRPYIVNEKEYYFKAYVNNFLRDIVIRKLGDKSFRLSIDDYVICEDDRIYKSSEKHIPLYYVLNNFDKFYKYVLDKRITEIHINVVTIAMS